MQNRINPNPNFRSHLQMAGVFEENTKQSPAALALKQ